MQRDEIIDKLITRKLFGQSESLVLTDGLEEAFMGVTSTTPTRAIYDYWKCLDIIMQADGTDFDESLDWLNEFIEEDLGQHAPLYIKLL